MNNLRRNKCIFCMLLASIMLMQCSVSTRVPVNHVGEISAGGKKFVVNYKGKTRILVNPSLNGENLVAYPTSMTLKDSGTPKSDIVYLYLNKDVDSLENVKGYVYVPFSSIETIEIYEKQSARSVAYVLAGMGYVGYVIWILIIIVALTKSSCPFIYVHNDDNFIFSGEIYSGSTLPQLERHDFLHLPLIESINGNYTLKITNEVKEIQHTNLMELLLVDHSPGIQVHIDKYGSVHTSSSCTPPTNVFNLEGMDVKHLVLDKDSLSYGSEYLDIDSEALTDGIILTFDKPHKSNQAKILIKAKNTYWLDYSYIQFEEHFGKHHPKLSRIHQKMDKKELSNMRMDQKILLAVYIENNGEWEFREYFNIAGPMALKDDILSLDISGIHSDQVRIKLEYGFKFWEIDYVALDYSPDQMIKPILLNISNAKDNHNRDISNLLKEDDDQYYVQTTVGDEALISFVATPVPDSLERTIFLHNKGYYDILIKPSESKPKLRYIKTLRKPLQFTRFSKELYLNSYKDAARLFSGNEVEDN